MHTIHKTLLTAALALAALSSQAAPAAADKARDQDLGAFRQRFSEANPGTKVDAVSTTAVPGIYEVVSGRNVAYVESSGRYAFIGHLFDMREGRDVTEDRLAEIDRIDPRILPRDLAIRHVRGKGSKTLYVFADPQCGFCKQLEQTLQGLDDVTVYTYMLSILGPESRRLADAITCSAKPDQAWADWMLRGQRPVAAPEGCDTSAVDTVGKLARDLGVDGTPTMVAGDGRKATGAKDVASLKTWIAATTVKTKAGGTLATAK